MHSHPDSSSSVIGEVSSYIYHSMDKEIPSEVVTKAKHHILDSLGAIVSGSTLKPGLQAIKYAHQQAGVKESTVIGSSVVTSAVNAALANGMMGHADETDDSNPRAFIHPGCVIIPAALAMAEKEGADGTRLLRSVVLGYDLAARTTLALGVDHLRHAFRSTHSIGGCFGAAAAAAALAGIKDSEIGYVLSYTAQQASGMTHWINDDEHIQKAFVFGGMPARNGVTAVTMVQSGFTGVRDPFSGERNFFQTFSPEPKPQLLIEELGSRFEIMFTNIKKYSTGSPIQAPVEALLTLMGKYGLKASDIKSITARLGDRDASKTVADRSMPDINLKYLLAVTLLDGELTFAASHSFERMSDPAVLDLKKLITLVDDPVLVAAKPMRQGIVEVTTKDGSQLREHVVSVRGYVENPMTTEEVAKKCRELFIPVLGKERSDKLIDKIWNLEKVKNVRELRTLLSSS